MSSNPPLTNPIVGRWHYRSFLNDPANVAASVLFALQQQRGCEIKELIITASTEPSYP